MSRYVKDLISKDISARFGELDGCAVISPRGLDGLKTNKLRQQLLTKGIRITVVRNALAKRALGSSKLKGFDVLLDGPSALVYGKTSVPTIARALLEAKKTNEKLEIRGAFFDGEAFVGQSGIERVSKFPTREEALGSLVGLFVAPGRKLGGILKGQAGKVASLVKAVEERAEKAEAAAAVPAAPQA